MALVNVFWFTYPFIGYILFRIAAQSRKVPKQISQFGQAILRQHVFIIVLCSFALGVFAIGIPTAIGYLFTIPFAIISIWYLILLIVAVVFTVKLTWRRLFSTDEVDVFSLKHQPLIAKLAFIGLCFFLIGDYALALFARSLAAAGDDTYVHLSRIVAILHHGLTIDSGFFHNIPEVGYATNIVYALYALPSQLLHLTPGEVWSYSFGFLRLMQWIAIFALAWHVCSHWLRLRSQALLGASLTTIFAIGYFAATFFIAVYPNEIVNIWMTLFVIGLSYFDARKKIILWPLAAIAFLITFTHPTYALATGLFLGIVFITRWVLQRREFRGGELWQAFKSYALLETILAIVPIRAVMFPNHMTTAGVNFVVYKTWSIGFLTAKQPSFSYPLSPRIILIILGTVGMFFLLYKLRNRKQQLAIALSLIIFYPFMVYVPFVYTALHAVLPVWVIDRFMAMNVLNYIAVPLGVYGVISILGVILRRTRKLRWATTKRAAIVLFSLCMVLLSVPLMVKAPSKDVQYRKENAHYYAYMASTYASFHDILTNDQVIVADHGDSLLLAAVLPIDVIAIEDTHTTPAADAADRVACQNFVMKHFDYQDLKAVHASFVALSLYSRTFENDKAIVDSSSYLQFVRANGDFTIYKFLPDKGSSTEAPYGPCVQYQKVEK